MAQGEMKYRTLIIGGSAGSLDVILKIVPVLPQNSGLAFIIVVHRKNEPSSIFTNLLSTRTKMAVKEVEDKDAILPNVIYIAPPDYHLLIENETTFSLDVSEKIHFSRPSIDVSFESVAKTFGPSTIGILLSGANADGAKGLLEIKCNGGLTIAQDPSTADMGFMPQQAINLGAAAEVLDAENIVYKITQLLSGKK